MKKNILYILIDCFDRSRIGGDRYRNSPSPFLDRLRQNSFWADHMYSQGPYTEAALNATMCGHDTMDCGGYLKRYKDCPETLFETMQRAGYEVYAQMWPHIWPDSAMRGIDVVRLRPFSFPVLWYYRFQYYAEIDRQAGMEEQDWQDLTELMDQNLPYWIHYYEMLLSGDPQAEIVLKYSRPEGIAQDLLTLRREYETYQKDRKAYLREFMKQGTDHVLMSLYSTELLDYKIHREGFVESTTQMFRPSVERAVRLSRSRNLRNTRLSLSKMKVLWKQSEQPAKIWKRTPFSQYLRNYVSLLRCTSFRDQAAGHYDKQKDFLSLTGSFREFMNWKEQRRSDKPFFAYIHSEDIHGNPMLWDFCCEDEQLLKKQKERMDRYLDNLPKNYRGSLEYDLAILNVDFQLEQIFAELERRGMLEDTAVVINSDHGCGTDYFPLRDLVQSFHYECYNVPFAIVDRDLPARIDSRMAMTKDILPTLAQYVGVEPCEDVTGISLLSSEERQIVNQEYMGPGCPDIYRRPVWMCAFDSRWKVHIEASLRKPFSQCRIREIYNLETDPRELKNLVFRPDAAEKVQYLLKTLEKRFDTIKKDNPRTEQISE